MNTRLALRLGAVLAILLFMVIMGMSNHDSVPFHMGSAQWGEMPGAIMFFIFFASGVVVGSLLTLSFRSGGR
jgi:uncharacterized integral membrane protein